MFRRPLRIAAVAVPLQEQQGGEQALKIHHHGGAGERLANSARALADFTSRPPVLRVAIRALVGDKLEAVEIGAPHNGKVPLIVKGQLNLALGLAGEFVAHEAPLDSRRRRRRRPRCPEPCRCRRRSRR